MPTEYYFISDLHVGGDATLDLCEFEPELIDFLKDLEGKGERTELIVNGDAFGFWELTEETGVAKLRRIEANHPALFEQLRRTGERIRITLIPGNHDHELASDPGFAEVLAEHNVHLEPAEHITRSVGGRKIWIEHGHQRDWFNRIADFGNAHATPLGYYLTSLVVSNAGKYAVFGKEPWLKDLESVQPNQGIPHWLFSNYFYREMSPLIRMVTLPFILLFGLSAFALGGFALEFTGILPTRYFYDLFSRDLGLLGNLLGMILAVNAAVLALMIVVSVPLGFIKRDVAKTLKRYGVKSIAELLPEKRACYRAAARELFERDGEYAVFIYGHTHDAFLERVGPGVLLNTGTWLRKLTRVRSRWRLPDVHYPTCQLHAFRITAEGSDVVAYYEGRPKKIVPGLTLVERLSIIGRRRPGPIEIPARTVV